MFDIRNFLEEEKVDGIRCYSNNEWLNIIVGTVRSTRHISGILKKIKLLKLATKDSIFGEPENGWVICSFAEQDLHLFSQEKRDYYQIDVLWGDYEL